MPWPVLVAPRHSTTIKTRHPIPRPGLWRNITRYVGMLLYVCVSVYSPVVYGMWMCAETVLGLTYNRDVIITQIPVSGISTVRHVPTPTTTTTARTCYAAPSAVSNGTGQDLFGNHPPRHISDRYRAVLVEYQKVNLEPFREFPSSSRFNLHVHFLP